MKDIEKKHLSNNESNRLTCEAIRTSLLLLMEKKDFESITITELVKKPVFPGSHFTETIHQKKT